MNVPDPPKTALRTPLAEWDTPGMTLVAVFPSLGETV